MCCSGPVLHSAASWTLTLTPLRGSGMEQLYEGRQLAALRSLGAESHPGWAFLGPPSLTVSWDHPV